MSRRYGLTRMSERRGARGCGLGFAWILVPIVIAVVTLCNRTGDQAGALRYNVDGRPVAVNQDGGHPRWVAAATRFEGRDFTTVAVGLATEDGLAVKRWEHEIGEGSAGYVTIAVDGNDVMVGNRRDLLHLDGQTGEVRWRATLPDDVNWTCPSCFAFHDGLLVVRDQGGNLTAFDPERAVPLWKRPAAEDERPNASGNVASDETPLVAAGRYLLVRTGRGGATEAVEVRTGRRKPTGLPSCNDRSGAKVDQDADDPVWVTGATDAVALVDGRCLVRWEVGGGSVRWRSPVPVTLRPTPPETWYEGDGYRSIQPTADRLVVAGGTGLIDVDLGDGTVTGATSDAGPIGAVGVDRTGPVGLVGSEARGVRMIGWTDGRVRFTGPPMQGVSILADPQEPVPPAVIDQRAVTLAGAGTGLRLVELDAKDGRIIVKRVDAGDGSVTPIFGPRVPGVGGSMKVTEIGRDGLVITSGGHVALIGLDGGDPRWWPPPPADDTSS